MCRHWARTSQGFDRWVTGRRQSVRLDIVTLPIKHAAFATRLITHQSLAPAPKKLANSFGGGALPNIQRSVSGNTWLPWTLLCQPVPMTSFES